MFGIIKLVGIEKIEKLFGFFFRFNRFILLKIFFLFLVWVCKVDFILEDWVLKKKD